MENRQKRITERLEECSVAIWKEWLAQVAKLQVLWAYVGNRAKVEDNLYKMDEESIITIREELFDDFQAIAQVQMKEIRKILEAFEDN